MSTLDWIIVAAVVLSVLAAVVQGFFFEMFSLAGVLLGFLLGAWGYPLLAGKFMPFVRTPAIADLAAFLAIFFVVLLLAGITGRVARWVLHEAGLKTVDRVLGGAFGAVRGLAVCTVVVLALAAFAPDAKLLRDSALGPYLLVGARTAVTLAPADVKNKFRDGLAVLRSVQSPPTTGNAQAGPTGRTTP